VANANILLDIAAVNQILFAINIWRAGTLET
jgi:hypothetical protein